MFETAPLTHVPAHRQCECRIQMLRLGEIFRVSR
jgi:hypothetical protein